MALSSTCAFAGATEAWVVRARGCYCHEIVSDLVNNFNIITDGSLIVLSTSLILHSRFWIVSIEHSIMLVNTVSISLLVSLLFPVRGIS